MNLRSKPLTTLNLFIIALTLYSQMAVAQTPLIRDHTLKIFWWNIGGGGHDVTRSENLCSGSLNKNLSDLANDKTLHMITLGENMESNFCPEIYEKLKKNYPYSFSVPYNPDCPANSISVFSRLPLKLLKTENLDWGPVVENSGSSEEWKNNWLQKYPYVSPLCQERPYALFTGEFEGQAFYFVPVHLTDPWKPIMDVDGKFRTGLKIFLGHKNPNYQQVQRLKAKLNQLDPKIPLIVLGDFNFPASFLGYHSPGFSAMTGGIPMNLAPLFVDGQHASYPTKEANSKLPSILIDQAYGSFSFQAPDFKVLKWIGSDHYPILLKLPFEKPINSLKELIERLEDNPQSAK